MIFHASQIVGLIEIQSIDGAECVSALGAEGKNLGELLSWLSGGADCPPDGETDLAPSPATATSGPVNRLATLIGGGAERALVADLASLESDLADATVRLRLSLLAATAG
ncbi:MAG TPA: hypothetical protein VMF30_04825 [Pirellulales bacterium]|nr:hypothetical protein [Pirellulales bacterium]